MGERASIEPLKKPLEPQSDKLFGEYRDLMDLEGPIHRAVAEPLIFQFA